MTIGFASPNDAEKLTASIKAQVAGFWVPWKLAQSNVCEHLVEGKCPVQTGARVQYKLNVSIPRVAPIGIRVQVELQVQDEKRRTTVCVRLNVLVAA